jgi:rhamnulokinase
MKKPLNLLAVDLGAESGRTILGQFDGMKLSLQDVNRFPNGAVALPDGIHWDVLRLWGEMKSGISQACHQGGSIASVGIDTWGVDFGLLDTQGALIFNPFHYRDSRTDGMVDAVFQIIPREEVFNQTGIQFMQLNSLFQLYSMVKSKSPALQIAHTFLTMPDLFNYWFTGKKVSEFTIATTTQCYDPTVGNWAYPILEQLAIPTSIFPEIVPPGTILGNFSRYVSDEIGASMKVIAPACHDTGSAVAAVPAKGDDFVWISSGTWSIMGVTINKAVISPKSLQYNITNEGGAGGTFRFSKNIMGLWLVQECRRTWNKQGENFSYNDLTQMALQVEGLKSIYNPDDPEFLKPGDMPSRIQEVCRRTGQPVPITHGDIIRSALDSIALKYRWTLEKIEEITGKKLSTIHIVGGGTQNQLLSQLTADCTGKTVITGPIEATAIGNLLVQAIALGEISNIDQARELVRQSFEVHTFTPQNSALWDNVFQQSLSLLI